MRKFIYASATLLLLSGCNTIDGFGKDMGAIGQSFAGMFDGSVQNSRRIRDNSEFISRGNTPPMPQQGGAYGGGYGGAPAGGGYGGGYGGGGGVGALPPQFPPYQQPQQYQQQPRQPAMPYYYNEGY